MAKSILKKVLKLKKFQPKVVDPELLKPGQTVQNDPKKREDLLKDNSPEAQINRDIKHGRSPEQG